MVSDEASVDYGGVSDAGYAPMALYRCPASLPHNPTLITLHGCPRGVSIPHPDPVGFIPQGDGILLFGIPLPGGWRSLRMMGLMRRAIMQKKGHGFSSLFCFDCRGG